jgi:hypothetical protein
MSERSNESAWVKKELNSALMSEMSRRNVRIFPLKLDDAATIPGIIADKMYADFSKSYKAGLEALLKTLKGDV